ncbi:hypothetical protein ARTHRO9V_20176 [Arthrobacter sp. 9V]|nr:hypothetical protein ARTHRO9V_20176 [Arthrobacter sp. 9V]
MQLLRLVVTVSFTDVPVAGS